MVAGQGAGNHPSHADHCAWSNGWKGNSGSSRHDWKTAWRGSATGRRVAGMGDCASKLSFEDQGQRSRSEEHTSEFQSLMRRPYAVFCLKKQKTEYTQLLSL